MIIVIKEVYLKEKHVIWNIYVTIGPNTLISHSSKHETFTDIKLNVPFVKYKTIQDKLFTLSCLKILRNFCYNFSFDKKFQLINIINNKNTGINC
jgi:hypothetical protein